MSDEAATTQVPRPGWVDLAGLAFTFFALGVTVNVLVLERVGSESKTIVAAALINSATSELAFLAVRDAGGTVLASLVAGWIVASRFGLLAVSLGSRMSAGRAHRAVAASQAFDPNVALSIQQPEPRSVTKVFWTVTAAMLVGWYLGTFTGVFLGNVIGDTKRLGLDTVFPAALLAIIGNLLRRPPGAVAALTGGGLCLVMIPWAPAGVPIIVSLVGAFIALRVPDAGPDASEAPR
jgi:predicted branched-subunit amino acid permease